MTIAHFFEVIQISEILSTGVPNFVFLDVSSLASALPELKKSVVHLKNRRNKGCGMKKLRNLSTNETPLSILGRSAYYRVKTLNHLTCVYVDSFHIKIITTILASSRSKSGTTSGLWKLFATSSIDRHKESALPSPMPLSRPRLIQAAPLPMAEPLSPECSFTASKGFTTFA